MLDEFYPCFERRGAFARRVLEVEPNESIARLIAVRLPEGCRPVERVENLLLPGTRVFLVDAVGVLIGGVQYLDGKPDVHVGFWDKVLFGREAMCRAVAAIVAHDDDCDGVWTAVPDTSRATLAFAKRVGFTERSTIGRNVVLTLVT